MSEEQGRAQPAQGSAVTDGGVAGADPQLTDLQQQLQTMKAEAVQNSEKFLRARADMENIRRRAEIDVSNAHKYAIERFASELVAVRDSLELARTVDIRQESDTALQKMHQGLDLTLKLMDDVLRKFSVTIVDPKGEKFDPAKHQAISMVESNEVPPNHVAAVMQKGYLLHDRVIRPAMVVVARAPATQPTE
ncbi:MAG: nucleotide exchange factor GrpE [Gammaproteobacteria bacterium]|nr:nucleotide exchange factor GrpE [Gammaproteobacteria bacterium]